METPRKATERHLPYGITRRSTQVNATCFNFNQTGRFSI